MRDKIKTMTARKTKLFTILKNFTTEIEEELKAQWKDFEEFLQYINIYKMWYFCKYKDILGKPKTGLHSYRVFDIAVVDFLLTILLAKFFEFYMMKGIPFWKILIITFILGIIVHRIFCVKTTIDKLLFS